MAKPQPSYSKEFKQEAVRLVETSTKNKAEIARDLGISESALSKWCKEFANHGETDTGSVGATMAPTSRANNQGRPVPQKRAIATTNSESTMPGSASKTIGSQSAFSRSISAFQAPSKRSAGIKTVVDGDSTWCCLDHLRYPHPVYTHHLNIYPGSLPDPRWRS